MLLITGEPLGEKELILFLSKISCNKEERCADMASDMFPPRAFPLISKIVLH